MPDQFPIDLGREPMGPEAIAMPSKEKYCPSVHLDWDKPYDLPDSGEMVVKFKKTNESKNTRTVDGKPKTTYSVTLELQSIESVDPGDDEDSDEEGDSEEEMPMMREDNLDKLAKRGKYKEED